MVSVIICTYQRSSLLPRAIRSVLTQDYQDFELLIIDDGSRDDTAQAVGAFSDPRIRFLPQLENRGVAVCTNVGLRAARGDLIAFLGDDDEFLPTFLGRIVEFVSNGDRAFAWCGIEEHSAEPPYLVTQKMVTFPPTASRAERQQATMRIGSGHGLTIRRECLDRVALFDKTLRHAVDLEYLIRLVQPEWTWGCLEEHLVNVHRQPSRLTQPSADRLRALEYIVSKHRTFLESHPPTWRALAIRRASVSISLGLIPQARTILVALLRQRLFDRQAWRLLLSAELRRFWLGRTILEFRYTPIQRAETPTV